MSSVLHQYLFSVSKILAYNYINLSTHSSVLSGTLHFLKMVTKVFPIPCMLPHQEGQPIFLFLESRLSFVSASMNRMTQKWHCMTCGSQAIKSEGASARFSLRMPSLGTSHHVLKEVQIPEKSLVCTLASSPGVVSANSQPLPSGLLLKESSHCSISSGDKLKYSYQDQNKCHLTDWLTHSLASDPCFISLKNRFFS
jgi:hypothetical protein